jgi:hypothetical protein
MGFAMHCHGSGALQEIRADGLDGIDLSPAILVSPAMPVFTASVSRGNLSGLAASYLPRKGQRSSVGRATDS